MAAQGSCPDVKLPGVCYCLRHFTADQRTRLYSDQYRCLLPVMSPAPHCSSQDQNGCHRKTFSVIYSVSVQESDMFSVRFLGISNHLLTTNSSVAADVNMRFSAGYI